MVVFSKKPIQKHYAEPPVINDSVIEKPQTNKIVELVADPIISKTIEQDIDASNDNIYDSEEDIETPNVVNEIAPKAKLTQSIQAVKPKPIQLPKKQQLQRIILFKESILSKK